MKMFCYQCEQTAKGTGCEVSGLCGKKPDVSDIQDLIIYQLRGIAFWADKVSEKGKHSGKIDKYTMEALFTTVTNVNFDPERLIFVLKEGEKVLTEARQLSEFEGKAPAPALLNLASSDEEITAQSEQHGIMELGKNNDERSLSHILLYGLKGMAAYADHAYIMGEKDREVLDFFYRSLTALGKPETDSAALLNLCLECGEKNIRTMELLDRAHNNLFGEPSPAEVDTGLKEGPAIVVSGHDLPDLKALLEQTEGTGVNIYTHGEMLPAHGYPELRKFSHLAGHYGSAWQNQQKEFDNMPAAVLFTTNCIQKPRESYSDRVFTTGLVAWPGCKHVKDRDFSAVIKKAKELGGFEKTEGKKLLTGFGHKAVLKKAPAIVEAVKEGKIRHFFLIGGCDGAKPGRNYYTEFAEKTPPDTLILTLACGKFRINGLDLGEIGGFPRILDLGQCNDAYSAVVIAN
ncbi:MAG: hydroxylamine reductase, partial [Fibrobacterota bacterium]